MGEASVEWIGLDTFIAKIQGIGEKAPDKARSIMKEIGDTAKDTMDANTPVRTGDLKSHNRVEEDDSGGFVLINDSDHAIFLEMGTRYMSAQPFLAPAMEQAAQDLDRLHEVFEE
jgi:HK97 gp10 family phage protein